MLWWKHVSGDSLGKRVRPLLLNIVQNFIYSLSSPEICSDIMLCVLSESLHQRKEEGVQTQLCTQLKVPGAVFL